MAGTRPGIALQFNPILVTSLSDMREAAK